MTTNARDEKWSEWIDWSGGECPLPDGAMHEVEYRTGVRCKDNLPETSYWGCDGDDCDIIAYRYKIKETESVMNNEIPEDLKLCAEHLTEWPEGAYWVAAFEHRDGVRVIGWPRNSPPTTVPAYNWEVVSYARQQLGIGSEGIADPEEEECIQLAYERMNEESVKVSIDDLCEQSKSSGGDNDYWIATVNKPKRLEPYQAECEDLIELFQMTFQEGEAFKALWRKGQLRIGNGKPGDTLLRNSEKAYHYSGRMVAMESE